MYMFCETLNKDSLDNFDTGENAWCGYLYTAGLVFKKENANGYII